MNDRPVLYLDLDDTILTWESGEPAPAKGVREFLLWALEHYEVRWLTRWAPDGRMDPDLLVDLSKLTGVETERLKEIRGLDWEGGSKLDGIAWVEHLVMERPFIWMEDDNTGAEHCSFLVLHGFGECFRRCNVTQNANALRQVHAEMKAAQKYPPRQPRIIARA